MSASPRGRAVGIIGTGRVGSVLAAALADAGHPVVTGRPDAMTGSVKSPYDAYIAKPYLPSEVAAMIHQLTGL